MEAQATSNANALLLQFPPPCHSTRSHRRGLCQFPPVYPRARDSHTRHPPDYHSYPKWAYSDWLHPMTTEIAHWRVFHADTRRFLCDLPTIRVYGKGYTSRLARSLAVYIYI